MSKPFPEKDEYMKQKKARQEKRAEKAYKELRAMLDDRFEAGQIPAHDVDITPVFATHGSLMFIALERLKIELENAHWEVSWKQHKAGPMDVHETVTMSIV